MTPWLWAVPPVVANVIVICPYAVPGVVAYRQVALSLVVTCNVADVVPAGRVPVGRAPDTTGATVSGAGGLTGVTMSVWISAATKARL